MSLAPTRALDAPAYSPLSSLPSSDSGTGVQEFGDIVAMWQSDRDGDKVTAYVYSPSDGLEGGDAPRLLAIVAQDLEDDTVTVTDITASQNDVAENRHVSEFQLQDGEVVQTAGPHTEVLNDGDYRKQSPGNINFPVNGQAYVSLEITNPDGPPPEEFDESERASDFGGAGIQVGLQLGLDDDTDPGSLMTIIHTREHEELNPDFPDFESFYILNDSFGMGDDTADPNRLKMGDNSDSFVTPEPPKEDNTFWYNPTTWGDNTNERWYNPFSWGWGDGN